MTTPPYQYRPLNRQRNEIRLLHIESIKAGKDHGYKGRVIFGHIEHVVIDEYIYRAISYVWGEPNYNCALITPEGHLPITDNLVRAIHHVCKADLATSSPSYLPFWIDAICINQKDDQEKSWQVAEMMPNIYAFSEVTACFLGPDEFKKGYTKSAFDYIHHLGNVAMEHDIFTATDKIRTCVKDLLESRRSQQALPAASRDLKSTDAHASLSDIDGSLQAVVYALMFEDENTLSNIGHEKQLHLFILLGCMMDRDWWTRIWVIQELCMARRAVFIYGDASISATRLMAVLWLLRIIMDELISSDSRQLLGTTYGFIANMDDRLRAPAVLFFTNYVMTQGSSSEYKPNLGTIFEILELRDLKMGATDPRDFIYGLLGLVQWWPDRDNAIVPNYSITGEEVFAWTAQWLLSQSRCKILRAACEPKSMENLPSWVPDWSHRRRTGIGQEPQIQWDPYTYRFWITENGRHIVCLEGYILGRIRKCETFPEDAARPHLEMRAAETCVETMHWADDAEVIKRGLLKWKNFLSHHFTDTIELASYQNRLARIVLLITGHHPSLDDGELERALQFPITEPQSNNPLEFWHVAQTIYSLLADPTRLDSINLFNLSKDEKLDAYFSWQHGKTEWSDDLDMLFALTPVERSLLYYTVFLVDRTYIGAAYGSIEDGDILVRLDADPTSLYILRSVEDDLFKLVTRASVPQLWPRSTYEYGERGEFNLC